MPGPIPNTSGGDDSNITSDINKTNSAAAATEPNSLKTPAATANFDPKEIGDEDFQKVFDDPRLFQHSRFKQLNERAKRAAELEKIQQDSETQKLKEAQKWQELAEKTESQKAEIEQKYKTTLIDMKIQAEAAKVGAIDAEAVAKLIDRSAIAIDDNGNVTGVETAMIAMQESKQYLFGQGGNARLGNATNPGTDGNRAGKRFTKSQIQDPQFYAENEQDILQAFKQGLIVDDQ